MKNSDILSLKKSFSLKKKTYESFYYETKYSFIYGDYFVNPHIETKFKFYLLEKVREPAIIIALIMILFYSSKIVIYSSFVPNGTTFDTTKSTISLVYNSLLILITVLSSFFGFCKSTGYMTKSIMLFIIYLCVLSVHYFTYFLNIFTSLINPDILY